MSPAVNVTLEEVPFAILEAVKARIMANRRRLDESRAEPRRSTRPRPQYRLAGASTKAWRPPPRRAGVIPDEGVDIAVIDVEIYSGEDFNISRNNKYWDEYRKTHPDRPFILIQPRLGTTLPPILTPNGFNNNGYKIEVSRPRAGRGSSTNWYAVIQEIIDISRYNNFRIRVYQLGTMTTETVTPDLQNFILKLKSTRWAQFYNADGFAPFVEEWIKPFIADDIDSLV